MKRLANYVPAFDWLAEYESEWLKGDAAAGVTVGVMLIPQGMAYAMLAGVEPIYGLYAAVIPLVVYALLGTSRHLAVGTVAIDMLVVSAGVGPLVAEGLPPAEYAAQYAALAVVLALMVGVIEITMGVLRFGFLVNFLSRPVIAGFMTAAPLIIASSQIGNLLGEDLPRSSMVHEMIMAAIEHTSQIDPIAATIGAAGIVVLLALQKLRPNWPSALIWVVLALGVSWGFGLAGQGVPVVGEIPGGRLPVALPEVSSQAIADLLPTAITLALVQFMSVMSLGKVFEAEHDYSVEANKELIAIGSANALGSLFKSIPVSGSFSRSAVNERAGANTPLANVFAAGLVALAIFFLTPVFEILPIAALAAIIVVASIGLVDIPELRFLLQTRRIDGGLALLTFGATLGIGIQEGLLIGIGASLLVVLYDLTRAKVQELGHIPGTKEFRNVERHPEAESIDEEIHSDIHIVRIDARFSFANAEQLETELLDVIEGQGVRAVVMELSGVNSLDTTACAMLSDVVEELEGRGITLYVAGAKDPVRKVMRRAGLFDEIGRERFFVNTHQAVKSIMESWGRGEEYEYPGRELEDKRQDLDEARQKLEAERKRIVAEREELQSEIEAQQDEQEKLQEERDALRRQLQEARRQQDARGKEQERDELEERRERMKQARERLQEQKRDEQAGEAEGEPEE